MRLWTSSQRAAALERAERDGVDLLVIGGGITGAAVLRDAASRGLRALLVERDDFASGTSSASSKMIHGGLRYIEEGQLRLTREACRERDRLLRLDPHLVRPVEFLLPSYEDGRLPLWQVRAALLIYAGLANFRRTARFRMLTPEQAHGFCPALRREGLRGAGLYVDGQVDDARLVLETLKSARGLGAEAVNHAELVEFVRGADDRLEGARVRDRLAGRTLWIRAGAFVNAAGPGAERVRGLHRAPAATELRPAKGIHLVIPRERIPTRGCVSFEAPDGRQLFIHPFGDVTLVGTTDDFSDEIDQPVVRIEEVHYLLSAANRAFPQAALTTNDLRSVYAGVRPLIAPADATAPASSASREHRIEADETGLVSAWGGKLTTHRAMGERIVDRALRQLPAARRAAAGSSRTWNTPLREDDFDRPVFEAELEGRYGLPRACVEELVRNHGAEAATLLAEAPPQLRAPIGRSRFVYAEIPWAFRTECPATLCDLLEHRLRLAVFAIGQGLGELDRVARVAGEAAGWDETRIRLETDDYVAAVRRGYQIVAPTGSARTAA
ncbi:MAG: glycerol-3-phosphate dehydrogenase/oxidase [Myxococcota bacterium]